MWVTSCLNPTQEGIATMDLEFLFKLSSSGGNGCPAFYRAGADFVVQGYTLTADETGQMRQVADDEAGVRIPNELYGQIGERWARENGLLP